MFTGLVEDIGIVAENRPAGATRTLRVKTAIDTTDIRMGAHKPALLHR